MQPNCRVELKQSTITVESGGLYINGFVCTGEREIPIKIDVGKIMTTHTKMAQDGKKRCRINAVVILL